jgi:DNA-binding NarL/FixJ family response regulator
MLSPAKIMIVDDHPMVREGLAMHLATQSDMAICAEAEDPDGAMNAIETTRPDLVIIDISLKNGNGIDLIHRIRDRDNGLRILVWSMYPENLYAERALRAGARGYLNKDRATCELLEAIRSVLAGKVFVSGDVTEKVLQQIAAGDAIHHSPVHSLSDRELQAFEMMGHGLTTEVIAAKMHVSSKTIETYRIRIKQKLGLKNVTEVIQRATQWVLELHSAETPKASTDGSQMMGGN